MVLPPPMSPAPSSASTAAAAFLLFLLLAVLVRWRNWSKRRDLGLPGPRHLPSLPVVGQSYSLLFTDDPQKKITKMSKTYGPIYQFDVGPLPTVFVASPDLILEALAHRSMQGRPYNMQKSFQVMMKGQGVEGALPGFAGSQGRNWKEQRGFFVGQLRKNSSAVSSPGSAYTSAKRSNAEAGGSGFVGNTVEEVDRVVEEEADAMVDRLTGMVAAGNNRVSMHQFFMGATVNIIWRLATGQKLAYDDPKLVDVSKKIYQFFKFLRPGPSSFLQLQYPWLMRLCQRLNLKTGLNTYTGLIDLLEREVQAGPQMCAAAEEGDVIGGRPHDVIGGSENKLISSYLFLAARSQPGSSLHGQVGRTNLVATLADIFMGGADTTNNQHEWIILCVARFPDWQEKIREEIRREFGPGAKNLKLPELMLAPMTEAFLLEVQRLRPIAPLALPRMTTEDCELAGYKIPKDTQVLVDLTANLRDASFFGDGDPDRFDPTRFLRPDGTVCPEKRLRVARNFGSGRRRCPGEKVARAELFVFLAKMVDAFRFGEICSPASGRRDPFETGYFGLNFVPHPFSLKVTKV